MENQKKELVKAEASQLKKVPGGAIKSVCAKIRLYEQKGELTNIQGKFTISAAGYNTLNKIAGISVLTPKKLILPNGDIVINPYPIVDPKSGSISKVWVKKLAIGYSPIGNLVITSSTLLYDVRMYFIQDLVKKIKKDKAAGKICTESMLTDKEKATGIFLPTEGAIGVWGNLQNSDALTCFETFIQNKLFAERKAQTICERNCLKKHPALAFSQLMVAGTEKRHYSEVTVHGWSHNLTKEDFMRLERMYDDNEEITEYKGTHVEEIESDDHISDEDLVASEDEPVVKEETPAIPERTAEPIEQQIVVNNNENVKKQHEEKINEKDNEQEKVAYKENDREQFIENIEEDKMLLGDKNFNDVMSKNFGDKSLDDLTIGQLQMLKKAVEARMEVEEPIDDGDIPF